MSKKTFFMDARLPVSESTSSDDPSHPKNVSRGMLIIQNQASADTKYDIYPPPRIASEGFVNPEANEFRILIALGVILLGLIIVVIATSTYVRIAGIVIIMLSIQYALYKLENRTV